MTITVDTLRARVPTAENWEDRGDGLYRATEPFTYGYRYFLLAQEQVALVDGNEVRHPASWASGPASPEIRDDPEMEAALRQVLEREIEYNRLPVCVVPDCGKKAPMVFRAVEHGRLAGQDWRAGEAIRTCPPHGEDIYLAQGVYGRDKLAEWLRADAKLDALDAYDAGSDIMHGNEIRENRARMLVVKIPTR